MTTTATAPTATPDSTASQATSTAQTAAFAGVRRIPPPVNDPNRSYAPGTPERAELKARLGKLEALLAPKEAAAKTSDVHRDGDKPEGEKEDKAKKRKKDERASR